MKIDKILGFNSLKEKNRYTEEHHDGHFGLSKNLVVSENLGKFYDFYCLSRVISHLPEEHRKKHGLDPECATYATLSRNDLIKLRELIQYVLDNE